MDHLIAQITSLAATADEAGRKKVLDGLRELQFSIESHQESAERIFHSELQIAVVRIGCDLRLFDTLCEHGTPMTVDELAQKLSTQSLLLGRILRYLASFGCVKEVAQDTFTKSNISETFAIPGFRSGIYHNFDAMGPGFHALPDFLKEQNYRGEASDDNCPLLKGWNTTLPSYIWYHTKPELFAHFNTYMAGQRSQELSSWLDTYPYKKTVENLSPEQPLFVDVGGGIGHQSIEFREKLPDVPNKVVLQDIPAALDHAIEHPGVESIVQDFNQPQQIKGARIYYMRNIMHNYNDTKCQPILKHTFEAMGPDSVLLIDDLVLPNIGVHWRAAQLDITMLSVLGAIERTMDMWHALLALAGFKIVQIYKYTQGRDDSIIECVRM